MPKDASDNALQHQFDDLRQQQEADALGMWIFLATELLLFAGLFVGYFVYRAQYPEVFAAASQRLHLWLGAINTAVLLTSSLTIALATVAVEHKNRVWLNRLLTATLLLGVVFLIIKGFEYRAEIHEGLAPLPGLDFHFDGPQPEQAQLFFNFYFVMTGIHALHLIAGIAIIGVMIVLANRRQPWERLKSRIEMSGLYWHFIDIIWVFLFPILYLIDR